MGALVSDGDTFVFNKEDGKWTQWYDNGIMQDEGTFKAGLMNGNWKGCSNC